MRHKNQGRKLGRTTSHRLSMLANMAGSLLEHERIETTLPKAKETRRLAEKLITLGKTDTIHARRRAFATLRSEDLVTKLFKVLGPRFKTRPGGYTRVLKAGFRHGDSAPRAVIELVDRDTSVKGQDDKARHEEMLKAQENA